MSRPVVLVPSYLLVVFLLCAGLAVHGFRPTVTPQQRTLLTTRARLVPRMTAAAAVDTVGKALYDAAYAGDVAKMKALLAACKGNKNVLNWAVEERYGRTPLVIAAYYGTLEAVQLLLATNGIDVNKGSDFGATPLHFAAHRGHVGVVKALLAQRGIKVNVEATGGKWEGKTALDVCSRDDIAALLQAKGAK